MNETKTTASGPRFTHTRHASAFLRAPLPPALLEKVPAKTRREHDALLARVEAASREYGRLRAELADAPRHDREAESAAAREGRELPSPSESRLRGEIEQAQRVRRALDDALAASANALLAAAATHAEQVADELEAQLADGAADVRARLADLREGVAELGELFIAAAWTRSLAEAGEETTTVHAFQSGRSSAFTATLGELTTVAAAFDEDVANAEERRRLARDERAQQRQVAEQWERERASAAERRAKADAEA
jgi:hypothetical protein